MNIIIVYRCAYLQLKANKEIDLFGQSTEDTTNELMKLSDKLNGDEGTAFILLVQQYQEYEAAYLNWLSALGRRHNAYTPKDYRKADGDITRYKSIMNNLLPHLRIANLID